MNFLPDNTANNIMASRQRNILHIVHRLTFGGAERVLVNYLNGSQGHHHVVCSFFEADSFAAEIKDSNIQLINLNKKVGNDTSIPRKLAKICDDFKIDVIHCQGWGTYLEGLICAKIIKRRIKFVFAFHGKTIADLEGVPLRRVLAQRLGSYLGDSIIAPSKEMCLDYAKSYGVSASRIRVIHNGVDTQLFSPKNGVSGTKQQIGFDPGDIILGCVARLDPVKNFPGLIRAFADARKNDNAFKLLIVGDGPQMDDLKNLTAELGVTDSVVFTGRRDDVPDCLQAMDFYVQASFYEGFSMTILEAMSCGLPVIAYDVGGTNEIVKNGVNGILLLEGHEETDSLEKAISSLALNQEKRLRMGENARTVVEEQFSLKKMNSMYDQLFATV